MEYIESFLNEVAEISKKIDRTAIEQIVNLLRSVREKNGRLFILGVGGSAANAAHAANDFRRIDHIDTYVPMQNIAELTAHVNDDGWDSVFVGGLKHSKLSENDVVMVFSVGGGSAEKNISKNIVHALDHAKESGAKVVGIVSRDGGYTAKVADLCILIPVVNPENVTAHAESWQEIIFHIMAFHPKLKMVEGKWEAMQKPQS